MARNRSIYLPIDASFCDTAATRRVMSKYGYQGFYAYARLLCMMLSEPTGKLPVELEEDWKDLAEQFKMSVKDAKELIATLQHYDALGIEEGKLYSLDIIESMTARMEYEDARRKGAYAAAEAKRQKKKLAEN